MQFLKHVVEDIKQGDNLDLYITVMAALVLVTLNVIGVSIAQPLISTLTLAVLALLAIAILGNRHRLETIIQKTSQGKTELFVEHFSDEVQNEIREKIEESRDLLAMGTNLERTLHLYYQLFESKLLKGDSIRIVLVNPDTTAHQFTAYKQYRPISPELERAKTISSLDGLCKLKAKTSGKLEVRVIDYPLGHGGILVDSATCDGALFLWEYTFKTHTGNSPKFILHPTDGQWYAHFREEADAIWNNALPWECKKE